MPVAIDNMINRTNAEIVQILSSEPAESRRPPARAVYTHVRTNAGSWQSRLAQYENAAKDIGVSSSEYFNKK